MDSNRELVDYLVDRGYIESDRIEEAFRTVDRADFIEKSPYIDRPLKIEEGATISAPHIVAMMLELLEPEGRVLEMGSGSGYALALLDELADQVIGVERIESLVKKSRDRVPKAEIIHGYEAPDRKFDRVLYSFAAPEENVKEKIEKTEASISVAPVMEDGRQVLKKYSDGEESSESFVRFVKRKEGIRSE